MAQRWEDYERAAEKGPWPIILKVVGGLMLLAILLGGVGVVMNVLGFFGGAANNAVGVAKREFYPQELLRKYEWFKDAGAALDAKRASLKVYDARFSDLQKQYGETPRSGWPREDREQDSLWRSESAGIKASYNQLAAEYNAQMAKFNWRFTNVGDLPPGASEPLPREFKPYAEE